MVEQPLRPVPGGRAGLLGQLPAVLALHTGQQATKERSRPAADLHATKPARDPLAQRLQLLRARSSGLGGQALRGEGVERDGDGAVGVDGGVVGDAEKGVVARPRPGDPEDDLLRRGDRRLAEPVVVVEEG
jgi:hypothetical protein